MPRSAERADGATAANVFNIAAGQPFLRTLAAALLAGDLPRRGGEKPSPLTLSSYTLLLPTRRATRALQDAFLAESGGRAMLLPKIRPIAEGQEDLSIIAGTSGGDGADAADIPPAISELARRLTLTELVLAWSRQMREAQKAAGDASTAALASMAGASTPAQAANLAKELAGLMDLVETENVKLDGLKSLVPEDFSEHWGKTLEFLKIIIEIWPAFLAEQGRISAVERRNRVLLAEAHRLETMPPKGPVIIAGVTGSIPATARLMSVVAGLPNGAIVLPNFDRAIDPAEAALIAEKHPEHPQHGLVRLVRSLGLAAADVQDLRAPQTTPATEARRRFLTEMMRPAATTSAWHGYVAVAGKQATADGLAGMHRLDAANAQEEAEAIALIMREALEKPGVTAALISPDRLLARRVGVRLATWGINIDDSAGRPFAKTVPGAFLDLILEAIHQDFKPAPTIALLKHPLTRLGLSASAVRRAGRFLELTAFRTTYLGRGLDGIDAAVERAAREAAGDRAADEVGTRRPNAVRRLWDADWVAARDLVKRLREAFAPWRDAIKPETPYPLQTFAVAHIAVAEAIAKLPDDDAGKPEDAATVANPLWRGEAGETAQTFFAAVMDTSLRAPPLTLDDYPEFYRGLVANEAVRPRVPVHPRLSIWGPFEARLQQPDIVILGSLNEGTWPEAADPGPWLNRPMRAQLTLPSPEERIGHAAHDFAALLGANKVYLTRALKVDGVPTVPSRWLMRMDALLSGLAIELPQEQEKPWLSWARARDSAGEPAPVKAPAPCPPLELRPRKLSVTQIERWIANPYAIFASHVLKLEALPALGEEPGPSLRGAIIHAALGRFATRNPSSLPADIYAELNADIAAVLNDYTGHARVAAFWQPRFERFARWFADTEADRRAGVITVVPEVTGKLALSGPAGPFMLNARADRIDIRRDGATIIDYKTGTPPSANRVELGLAPQLPLEAAILVAGGFDKITSKDITALAYVHVRGGHPPGEYIALKVGDVAGVARDARLGLERMIERYDDPATPYRALRRASFANAYEYDDFAHLARVGEWSAGDEGEG